MSNAEVKAALHGVKLPPRDAVAEWMEKHLPGIGEAAQDAEIERVHETVIHLSQEDLKRDQAEANFVLRIDLNNLLTFLKTLTIGKVTVQLDAVTQVLSVEQGVPSDADIVGWEIDGNRLTLHLKVEDPANPKSSGFTLREAIEGRERDGCWSREAGWLRPAQP